MKTSKTLHISILITSILCLLLLLGCDALIDPMAQVEIAIRMDDHDIPLASTFILTGTKQKSRATISEEFSYPQRETIVLPLEPGTWELTAEAQIGGVPKATGSTTVTVKKGKRIKAVIDLSYTFEVTLDHGDGNNTTVEGTYASELPQDGTAPTKSDYIFGGYYDGPNGTGTQYYDENMVSTKEWDKAEDATLYAKWFVPITYDGQDATEPTVRHVVYRDTIGTLPSEPQKTGYTFEGWFTEPSGEGTPITAATVVTGCFTAYAKWSATITFDSPDATTNADPTSMKVVYTAGEDTLDSLPAEPKKVGFEFDGWRIGVSDEVFDVDTPITGNLTVYAAWKVLEITFAQGDSTVAGAVSLDSEGRPDRITIGDEITVDIIGEGRLEGSSQIYTVQFPDGDGTLYEIRVDEEGNAEIYQGVTRLEPTLASYSIDMIDSYYKSGSILANSEPYDHETEKGTTFSVFAGTTVTLAEADEDGEVEALQTAWYAQLNPGPYTIVTKDQSIEPLEFVSIDGLPGGNLFHVDEKGTITGIEIPKVGDDPLIFALSDSNAVPQTVSEPTAWMDEQDRIGLIFEQGGITYRLEPGPDGNGVIYQMDDVAYRLDENGQKIQVSALIVNFSVKLARASAAGNIVITKAIDGTGNGAPRPLTTGGISMGDFLSGTKFGLRAEPADSSADQFSIWGVKGAGSTFEDFSQPATTIRLGDVDAMAEVLFLSTENTPKWYYPESETSIRIPAGSTSSDLTVSTDKIYVEARDANQYSVNHIYIGHLENIESLTFYAHPDRVDDSYYVYADGSNILTAENVTSTGNIPDGAVLVPSDTSWEHESEKEKYMLQPFSGLDADSVGFKGWYVHVLVPSGTKWLTVSVPSGNWWVYGFHF